MTESVSHQVLLEQLQACGTQEERERLLMRFTLERLPEPLRDAVQAAAVPRFFDRAFLNALLDQPLDEAQFAELIGLSYIEPYPGEGRFNVHERSRKLLQEKLWQEDEALYREISRRAVAYCEKQDQNDITWRIETVYHQAVIQPEGKKIISLNKEDENEKWEVWLGSKESTTKIIQIRNAVTRLWQNIANDAARYHVAHATSIEDVLYRLIPENLHEKLFKIEKYYLLIAVWTHDIGMIRGIDVGDEEKFPQSIITDDYHRRSEWYLVNNYRMLKIEENDASALGLLAFFHRRREDLECCPEYFTIGNDKVRLRLLAAYLRLAHALDVESSLTLSSEYDISFTSKLHWIKSKLVSSIAVLPSEQRILVHFKHPHEKDLEKEIPQENDRRILQQYLARLQLNVMDGLKDVLDSVKNVLIRGGITWYRDIESVSTYVEI